MLSCIKVSHSEVLPVMGLVTRKSILTRFKDVINFYARIKVNMDGVKGHFNHFGR